MTDDTITIEVDGVPLQARRGQMLIEVTDANDNYVPRFCYHNKLSVAANCRMCLVEVEKAPKPLPACATPVMDGMKVFTRSKLALEAQKSVMEFLLINHPLDCPICDQGGECELQDLAMGYGSDVSRYQEKKRVVKDKDIGPLVHTDMTRCIHCTRCVRFGEEIAGLRELGATGRGEDMEIGTYIEKSMRSELSGNVIDICPVGALTSKPFRFSARTWEMTQHPGIAPHDGIGSNIHFHVKADRVKRVVPAENESINEIWLSDRDRFSYEGLYSDDRLTSPLVKKDDHWEAVEWDTAFDIVHERLESIIRSGGPNRVGGLISPTATSEELYLFQKLLRGLGTNNIDHRLHQTDFRDQDTAPVFPWLGQSIADLELLDAALIIGGYPRKEQPLLNHRLRKAALRGAAIMIVDAIEHELNFNTGARLIVPPADIACSLAAILKVLLEANKIDEKIDMLLAHVNPDRNHRRIAECLSSSQKGAVLLGNLAVAHPDYSTIRYLSGMIARVVNSTFGYLGESANSAGAWLSGAVPHRVAGGAKSDTSGLHARSMIESGLSAYLLLNVEPDLDCCDGQSALNAMQTAECVIAITPYKTKAIEQVADILLPMALYAENEGSYINVAGIKQSFAKVVNAPGEARPAWKILRVMANNHNLEDCIYNSLDDISIELDNLLPDIKPDNFGAWSTPDSIDRGNGSLQKIATIPMNSTDSLVRHATALQQTSDISDGAVHINAELAANRGISVQDRIKVTQNEFTAELPLIIDERLPENTVLIHGAHAGVSGLGPWFGEVMINKA